MKALLQRHRGFLGGLVAVVMAGLVAAAVLLERAHAATRMRRELQRNRQELHVLALRAPGEETLRHTSDELMDARRELGESQSALRARVARTSLTQRSVPETTAAAFFDLVEFGQRMRERAQQAGVRLRADERFGFAEHANTGPEAALIAAVFRQRLIVEHLLDALWAAGPDELIAVRRERPRSDHATASDPNSLAGADDGRGRFLEITSRVSSRQAGAIEATAFRLEFVGPTAALRSLLNSIAEDEWPLSVRLVEASPAEFAENENAVAGQADAGVLVQPRPTQFAVTIEFIEVPLADAVEVPRA